MSRALPTELKAVRVLLFLTTGIGLTVFGLVIPQGVDTTSLMSAYLAYVGQGVLTLILGFLVAPGRAWLVYVLCGYAAVAMLMTLVGMLGGDLGAVTQLIIPALICFLTLRPDSRAYLTGH
ncbi:hypothetical protein [Nocardiopsis trehalosi]|uniref:hypothetical protein n=1 Tax=Nocardiopsis trehalosi TaxID=109329 RepID=UPI00082A925D|nr:hypothetical protein [Nocardiopsis trehalosi]